MRRAGVIPAVLLATAATAQPVPPPPRLVPVFAVTALLGEAVKAGRTPYGERSFIPIVGGTVSGPRFNGRVLPGGWDWQLAADGCRKLHADYMIQGDDGAIVNVVNRATICQAPGAAPAPVTTSPSFEAPLGPHHWLNAGAYVGRLEVTEAAGRRAVRISVFRAE